MMLRILTTLLVFVVGRVAAQAVFAHFMVGNVNAYTVSNWESDMRLAGSKGIDAFVLNIAPPLAGNTETQTANAIQAASNVGFKVLFSFDYLGGGQPWSASDILQLLSQYAGTDAYFKTDGRPFVSTFEGPTNSDVNDWATIRSSLPGGIYFVPDWTSQGPGFRSDLIDGSFSWDMWPKGPENITTVTDRLFEGVMRPVGKSYMMGISPWFYTNLPQWNKAWVWRGDNVWYQRWQQAVDVVPDFVEIVTWNDFGESHYIGPIFDGAIPPGATYVPGYPHEAWLETLPYQIAAYKHAKNPSSPAPSVAAGEDKIVFWYRRTPAHAGSTDATGNACSSPINLFPQDTHCYAPGDILEDSIFAIALLSQPGSVSITIGNGQPYQVDNLSRGINFVSRPFNGETGDVTVQSSTGVSGQGICIEAAPADGVANFNAWVGCAGSCG